VTSTLEGKVAALVSSIVSEVEARVERAFAEATCLTPPVR
jgi:hypothetical protein